MAKIAQMPSQAIIDSFRGYLDFYKWCDLNIVRKWPRAPGRSRAPAVVAAQVPFAYVNQQASELPGYVIDTWKAMAQSGGLTWKDWMNRAYISGTFLPKDYYEE